MEIVKEKPNDKVSDIPNQMYLPHFNFRSSLIILVLVKNGYSNHY